jgi:Bacterial dnaA protein helix-turn-helix
MEASMYTIDQKVGIWRLSLEQIEATVAEHLGPGRVPGNRPGPCFSRQISMYLAKHVGGWSTTRIGRFYNGRHHSTVLHAIAKVERLRQIDESIDALIEVITAAVNPAVSGYEISFQTKERAVLIEAIAAQVLDRVLELGRSDHRALVGD